MADKTKKLIADTFLAIAEGLETGTFGAKPKIAVTAMGSEHGEETVMEGAVKAARRRCVFHWNRHSSRGHHRSRGRRG